MAVGARDTKQFRNLFQRALLSASIVFGVVTAITISVSYWLFLLVKEPESIARQTTVCLAIAAPAELVWIFVTLITRALIAQNMIWTVVGFGAVFAVFGVVGQFLAYWINSGALGLAFSYTIAGFITAAFVAIYTLIYQRELITNWDRESFTDLWETAWIILKTVAYQFSMRLFIEVGTIFIAILGPNDLAAQFILMRYGIIVLVTGMGFWTASVALMGRAAGRKNRSKFTRIFWTNISLFVVIGLFTFILLGALRYPLAYLSTSIVKVQNLLIDLTPVVGAFSTALMVWIGSHSLVLSLGRVNVPTITTLFAEFIIGIPTAIFLTFFTPLRLFGFYIGLLLSYLIKCCVIWTYYACFWETLLSTIENSDELLSKSELSPVLSKVDSVAGTTALNSKPENLIGSAYGADASNIKHDT